MYLLTQCLSSLTLKNINTIGYTDCSGRLRHSLITGNNLSVILDISATDIFISFLHATLYLYIPCHWHILKTFASSSVVCLFLITCGSKLPSLSLGVNNSNEPTLVRKVFEFLQFLRLFSSLLADK